MDFRQYDAGIGRFYGLDLLAEATPWATPNHFALNNPVMASDPTGLLSMSPESAFVFEMLDPNFSGSGGGGGFINLFMGGGSPLNNLKNFDPSGMGMGWGTGTGYGYINGFQGGLNPLLGTGTKVKQGIGGHWLIKRTETWSTINDGAWFGFNKLNYTPALHVEVNVSKTWVADKTDFHLGDMMPNFTTDIGGDLLSFKGLHHGVPEFETSLMKGRGAVSPGPFVLYAPGLSKNPSYSAHEPGHVLQFALLGIWYYPLVALPSLITAKMENAGEFYTEKSADQLWYLFSGESYEKK